MKTLIGSMRKLLRSMPRRLNNHEKQKKNRKRCRKTKKKRFFLSSIVEANLKDTTDIVDQKISDGNSGYL